LVPKHKKRAYAYQDGRKGNEVHNRKIDTKREGNRGERKRGRRVSYYDRGRLKTLLRKKKAQKTASKADEGPQKEKDTIEKEKG